MFPFFLCFPNHQYSENLEHICAIWLGSNATPWPDLDISEAKQNHQNGSFWNSVVMHAVSRNHKKMISTYCLNACEKYQFVICYIYIFTYIEFACLFTKWMQQWRLLLRPICQYFFWIHILDLSFSFRVHDNLYEQARDHKYILAFIKL